MPAAQHVVPQGVVPDGQQQPEDGSEQISLWPQHPAPQATAHPAA
jgi:hypothetical protein